MNSNDNSGGYVPARSDIVRSAKLRLLVIPFLVYCAWLIEIFLLNGKLHLFLHNDPAPLIVYTIFGCTVTGMLIPVLLIRKSFLSRATNLFQVGFRSLKRTLVFCILTSLVCVVLLAAFTPPDFGIQTAVVLFLLFLPTGIASVMICWVLLGTHIQAYVRNGGVIVSIMVGVVTTAFLFGGMSLAYAPLPVAPYQFVHSVGVGIPAALFFFAIRDVYATSIVTTTGLVFSSAGMIDPAILFPALPQILLSAAIAAGTLVAIHGYFMKNYTMVIVVEE